MIKQMPFAFTRQRITTKVEFWMGLPRTLKITSLIASCLLVYVVLIFASMFFSGIYRYIKLGQLVHQGYLVEAEGYERKLIFKIGNYEHHRSKITSYRITPVPVVEFDDSNLSAFCSAVTQFGLPISAEIKVNSSLTSLDGFENLSNLNHVRIIGANGLTDLSSLKDATGLEGLSLDDCHSLKNITPLSANKSISG